MGQWLRTPVTVAENPGSVPISHMAATTTHNSVWGITSLGARVTGVMLCRCWSLNSRLLIQWTDMSPAPWYYISVCLLIGYAYIHIYTIYIYSLENIYLNPVHIFFKLYILFLLFGGAVL